MEGSFPKFSIYPRSNWILTVLTSGLVDGGYKFEERSGVLRQLLQETFIDINDRM